MTIAPKNKPNPLIATIVNLFRSLVQNEIVAFILKRIGQAAITIFLASMLCFAIVQLAPGSYLDTLTQDPTLTPDTIETLKQNFGLDRPAYEQYWRWLTRIVTQGDFGRSFKYQQDVSILLRDRVPATLLLSLISLVLTWAIAIPLGILSAVKQNTIVDRTLQIVGYTGQGFPSFITALILLIVAQTLSPIFPVGDMTSVFHKDLSWFGRVLDVAWHAFLPAIALSITSFAGLQRLMRGQMLDVLRQDYVRTARAKGLPENRVIYVHALRNAINPLITLLGFEFASLLSGAFIAEFFFNWPGLGRLILEAVRAQDLYLVMASLMMGAVMLILGNLLADLLLKFVDPRIQLNADR
ncbi:MAG: ABC transporter permease [Oscillatoriales cyanobacterium]|jgi:peptide/nickel transport system permease protein|nr:MAG: ABC transporter permease [Oscillatoriales cyanobacterium]